MTLRRMSSQQTRRGRRTSWRQKRGRAARLWERCGGGSARCDGRPLRYTSRRALPAGNGDRTC
eukprot:290293-Prymnesium_polylepis.1